MYKLCPKSKRGYKEIKKTRGNGIVSLVLVDDDSLLVRSKEGKKKTKCITQDVLITCFRRKWFSSYKECAKNHLMLDEKVNLEVGISG